MNIPQYAAEVLKTLEGQGFEAYLVGGCVRDYIMGIEPHDFDVTTNAKPSQIKSAFAGYTTILTGEKHGTVAVVIDGNTIEITTYRIEKEYSDNRRPDSVEFSASLEEDLKRRDFTVNAMAMSLDGNIVDIFGGRDDLENGIIRAVGTAEKRFKEDSLRILRALRFASRFGFKLESGTSSAVHALSRLLVNISAERIRDEFTGIVRGTYAAEVLREYRDVIAIFIPEIALCFDFDQKSPWHKYDVWEHTLHALKECKNTEKIKLATFFHDIAKPDCYKEDESGRGHFKRHAELSAVKTRAILERLKYPKRLVSDVTAVIFNHRDVPKTKYDLRKLISQIGVGNTLDLIELQNADSLSKYEFCRKEAEIHDNNRKMVAEIIADGDCVSLKQLDISGNELVSMGFCGKEIGEVLSFLLDCIMQEKVENDKKLLKNCVKRTYAKR